MRIGLSIALAAVALASCTRQSLPDPVVAAPQFAAKFTIDGVDSEIAAGVDGFYLEPTYHENTSGVLEYVATFRKPDGNPTALEVVIQDDGWRLPVEPVQPDAALLPGDYELQQGDVALDNTRLRFCSFSGADGVTYDWNINGASYSTPWPEVELLVEETPLSVELIVTQPDGCSDSLIQVCETFDTQGLYADYFYETFAWQPTGLGNQIKLSYDGEAEAAAEIRWDILDGTTTVVEYGEQVWHTFSGDGPFRVTLTVTLINGHTFKYSDRVTPNVEGVCTANVHYLSPPINPDDEGSRVRIAYTAEDGTRYASYFSGCTSPVNGNFEILGIDDYTFVDPATGEERSARRLNVAFDCLLYNIENPSETLELEGFEGTIAVSFPQ